MKTYALLLLMALMLLFIPGRETQAADFTAGTAAELIAAINTANANATADTIQLTADITLTEVDNLEYGQNGLPSILTDGGNALNIEGNGYTISRDVEAAFFRIFYVTADSTLTLSDVTISNGSTQDNGIDYQIFGGGILAFGDLVLDNTRITQNVAGRGGGIYATGDLSIINGSIIGGEFGVDGNRTTAGGGGGVFHSAIDVFSQPLPEPSTLLIDSSYIAGNQARGGQGAGIFINNINATVQNGTWFYDNDGDNAGGGFAIVGDNSTLVMSDATISNNRTTSTFGGGGIFISNSGAVDIANSTFTNNSVSRYGGAAHIRGSRNVTIRDTLMLNNIANSGGDSIYSNGVSVINTDIPPVVSSQFIHIERTTMDSSGNSAMRFDGTSWEVYQNSTTTITKTLSILDSAIIANSLVANEHAIVIQDVIEGFMIGTNQAVMDVTTNIDMSNVTISGFDQAMAYTTAFSNYSGPDDATLTTNLNLRNVSTATDSTGITFDFPTLPQNVTNTINVDVTNSYLAGPAGSMDCIVTNNGTTVFNPSGNNNLSTGTSCASLGFTTVTPAELNLLAPADNGGQTPTIALGLGSVAIDASGVNATTADQRGALALGIRDIGAFESDGTIPLVSFVLSNSNVTEGDSTDVIVTVSDYSGIPINVDFSLSGNATSDDYTLTSSPAMVFTDNGSQVFTINTLVDENDEPEETLSVKLLLNGGAEVTSSNPQTLSIGEQPVFTSPPPSDGTVGLAYTHDLQTNSVPGVAFSLTAGALPDGLILSGAQITGTPTLFGTFTGTITATDIYGSAAQEFEISIADVPSFTSLPPRNGFTDVVYTHTYTATGSEPITYAVTSGSLPPGLALSDNTISGTPTEIGTFTGEVTATNAIGSTVQAFSISIRENGEIPRVYPAQDQILTSTSSGQWPNFRFEHVPGVLWYQAWVGPADYSRTDYFEWLPAFDDSPFAEEGSGICDVQTGICTIPADIWLINGTYEWWITVWYEGDTQANIDAAWTKTDFVVDFDPQSTTLNLTTPTAPVSTLAEITWAHDAETLWYHVWVGIVDSPTPTYYFDWVDSRVICIEGTCTLDLSEVTFDNGTYQVWFEKWGPDDYLNWGDLTPSPIAEITVGN